MLSHSRASTRPRWRRPLVAVAWVICGVLALFVAGCVAVGHEPGNRVTPVATHSTSSGAPVAESLTPALDHGATANAEGSAITSSSGHYEYTVASGDTVVGIAARFGVCLADVFGSNLGLAPNEADLQIGQKLRIARVEGPDHEADECLAAGNSMSDYP